MTHDYTADPSKVTLTGAHPNFNLLVDGNWPANTNSFDITVTLKIKNDSHEETVGTFKIYIQNCPFPSTNQSMGE